MFVSRKSPSPTVSDTAVADLRAEVVALRETNLLLISAQEDREGAADLYRSAAAKYREALSLYLTPGHLAELDRSP